MSWGRNRGRFLQPGGLTYSGCVRYSAEVLKYQRVEASIGILAQFPPTRVARKIPVFSPDEGALPIRIEMIHGRFI
jgi:hypothetical protein